jgi:hypothetical protein
MPVTISTPGSDPILSLEIQGILDTGSDCTLIPFSFLAKVNAQVSDRAIQIPVGGKCLREYKLMHKTISSKNFAFTMVGIILYLSILLTHYNLPITITRQLLVE